MDNASARTLLYDFGRDQFRLATQAVVGTQGELRYGSDPSSRAKLDPPDGTYWARVTRRIVREEQETLRLNTRRWVSEGLLFVQLFAPVSDSRALVRIDQIGEQVRNAFRTYQHAEMEFTNAWINDNVNDEPDWIRANVIADYAYRQFI